MMRVFRLQLIHEIMSSGVTLDKRECVHGDASFHHDIVPVMAK